MKKLILLIPVLCLCTTMNLHAQWDTITTFNQVIADLKTYDTYLFIAGNFTKKETADCYWSAYYDGGSVFCHTNMVGGSGIRKMDVFISDLYSADALSHGSAIGVSIWDGSTWDDGGSSNYSHALIYADDNDLYVGSDDGKIRKKTGIGSFQSFYNFTGNDKASCIIRYGSKLVFAGSFTAVNSVAANNIAQWDGTTWQPLGTGISTGARCMAVYNNELYVAGGITTAGGASVKNIARWNGTSWSAVGGGVTGTSLNGIRDMMVYNGKLFVVGDFTEIGGVTTNNVAMWNGSVWTAMNLDHGDNWVNCIEVYNNKIYVGTHDFAHSHLFRYKGTVGMNETDEISNMSIYPNPASSVINMDIPRGSSVEILNAAGQTLRSMNIADDHCSIDISALAKGIYMVRIMNSKGVAVKKVVKE